MSEQDKAGSKAESVSLELEESRQGAPAGERKPCVAVTGATGLVGASLVAFLAREGYSVRAVVRDAGDARARRLLGSGGRVSLAAADVREPVSLRSAFDGAEVVVHAAGTVDPFGRREAIFAVNVGGTINALEAARAAGVRQFIHISSLSVITGQGDQFDVDESASLKTCGEAYADSKVEAERVVMERSGEELPVTVLRPGFIYGPGERAWLPRLIASIEKGRAMLIDGGEKETNVIYVENLDRAVVSAILKPAAYGRVYNLTDGARVTKKELFDAISEEMGLPRVTRKVPGFLARAVCELVSSLAPALPDEVRRGLARYSRGAFRLAGVNQGFSIRRAEEELGYTDAVRIPFREGMKATLETFKRSEEPARSSGQGA